MMGCGGAPTGGLRCNDLCALSITNQEDKQSLGIQVRSHFSTKSFTEFPSRPSAKPTKRRLLRLARFAASSALASSV